MNKETQYFLMDTSQIEALRRLLIKVQQRIDEIFEEDCLPVKMKPSLFDNHQEGGKSRLDLEELF